jgi:hypothetical protein
VTWQILSQERPAERSAWAFLVDRFQHVTGQGKAADAVMAEARHFSGAIGREAAVFTNQPGQNQ